MINIFKKIARLLIIFVLSRKTNSQIKRSCKLNYQTILEGNNCISSKVDISNSKIGFGTYIGEGSTLFNTSIGKYCSISSNVNLVVGRHPTKTIVSTHPAFFSSSKQAGFTYVNKTIFEEICYADKDNNLIVKIGNDVWIGANVTILNGTIINDGAIIATGAVVTGVLEPYFIYGGVPAKKIGERFSKEEINFLLGFKWWDKSESWLKENVDLFSNINSFIEKNSE